MIEFIQTHPLFWTASIALVSMTIGATVGILAVGLCMMTAKQPGIKPLTAANDDVNRKVA